MTKPSKSIAGALAAAVLIVGLCACKEGPVERAGKQVDKAVEKAKDAVKKAYDAAKDAAKKKFDQEVAIYEASQKKGK